MISKFAAVRLVLAGAACAVFGAPEAMAQSNPWHPAQTTVPITVLVVPMASISFPSGANIHLTVPPSNSTLPNDGVLFTVVGNANAAVTAAPDDYLFVNPYIVGNTAFSGRWLGKATHVNGYEIGYNLAVEFPVFSSPQSLPGTNGGSTPGVPVNVSGGPVQGFLHMLASHRWTANATMPAVGDYHGNIVVTVAASP